VTAIEFALVAPALLTLTFGALDLGLLFWAKAGLQSVAALTARCGATGYTWGTTSCTSAATTSSYAVTTAGSTVMSGIISSSDVSVTSAATTCNSVSGKFFVVTITCPYFSGLPPPFSGYTLSVTACYAQA
jgi:Flp pilus assembly protein TadG